MILNKIYYPNLLGNQNKTAKNNIVWVADITELKLDKNNKFYVFICLDIHTNRIIATTSSQTIIKAQSIVKCLVKAINERFTDLPVVKTILHTDRGTQFSSLCYQNFTTQFKEFITPSMSRENTPTDNAVAERFMRTFKEHLINGKTIEQTIQESLIENINSSNTIKTRKCKSIVSLYVNKLNQKPNKKTFNKSPEKHDTDVDSASYYMIQPIHTKALSEHFGQDRRLIDVERYKSENLQVIDAFEQFALERINELNALKAELVDQTPFDEDEEHKLNVKIIERELKLFREITIANHQLVKDLVTESITQGVEPLREDIDGIQETMANEFAEVKKEIRKLLPKPRKQRDIQPLRDPLDQNLFPLFLMNAGRSAKRMRDLRRAQLRVAYTILFHCGLRINEIRELKQNDIETAIKAAQFNIIQHKTKQAHIHVLSSEAIEDLKNCRLDLKIIFEKYKFKYLFGKSKPLSKYHFIALVNNDLDQTCKKLEIPFNIKSHSFRINMITSLLKLTTVQNTADIIGHSDIRSTMQYRRYALSKKEIQEIMDQLPKKQSPEV